MLVIATAMIVLGVLGEWWYGGEAATESETLQSDATTKAANANRDAQTAIARAAALEINAAQLRADNLALEKQIAPRRLTPADLATLVTIIRQHPGQQIAIESYALDVEAAILGEQLIQMLRAGNFPFDDRRMTVAALGGAIIGIRLTGTNQVFSSDLRQAFRSFGFELVLAEEPPPVTGITSGNPFAPAPVNIFIGVKPIRQ